MKHWTHAMTIGVGLITCDQPERFQRCLASLPKSNVTIVVNDGGPPPFSLSPYPIDFLVENQTPHGRAKCKNDAISLLLQEGCEHIFLFDDRVCIKHTEIYHFYIAAAKTSGIRHMNFCRSSPDNLPRYAIRYPNGVGLTFFYSLDDPWSYFHHTVLREIGHLEEDYQQTVIKIIEHGFHPPYHWFVDLTESSDYLEVLPPQRCDLRQMLPDTSKEEVQKQLRALLGESQI